MTKSRIISLCVVIALVLMALLFIPGCFKYPTVESLENINFLSLNDKTMETEMTIKVKNQGLIGAVLTGMKSKIKIDDVYIGDGFSDEKVKLKSRGVTDIKVKTSIDVEEFSKLFKKIMKKKGTSTVEVDGEYLVSAGIKSIPIKATTTTEMDVSNQIKQMINNSLESTGFKIKKVAPKKVGLGETSMIVNLEIDNSFPFDYELASIDLDLFLSSNKKKFGDWKLTKNITIPQGSKKEIEGEVKVDNFSTFTQVGTVLFGKKTVTAKGKASVLVAGSVFEIPLEQEVPLSAKLF